MDGGYDWHVDDETDWSARGVYSGNLVRDASVAYIKEQQRSTKPFFLCESSNGRFGPPGSNGRPLLRTDVPFQECHSPFQVDQLYKDMYPQLAGSPVRQALAGMVTHTDEMIGDIVRQWRFLDLSRFPSR